MQLVEDLENVGSQNVAGWHEAPGKLTVELVGSSQDPALQPKERGEKNKTEVSPGGGGQSTAQILFS